MSGVLQWVGDRLLNFNSWNEERKCNQRQEKRRAEALASKAVPFSDANPRHSLSLLPLVATDTNGIGSQDSLQPQSYLLAKLPFELRNIIWEECLGGLVFHIYARRLVEEGFKQIVSHVICQSRVSETKATIFHRNCKRDPSEASKQLLALSLSCRRVYSETLPILYKRNKFIIAQSAPFLGRVWGSGRFNLLTTLRFDFWLDALPYVTLLSGGCIRGRKESEALEWCENWRTIAAMKCLQDLVVRIGCNPDAAPYLANGEAEIMLKMRAVTRPKKFLLIAYWPALPENEALWQELPCRIERHRAIKLYEERHSTDDESSVS